MDEHIILTHEVLQKCGALYLKEIFGLCLGSHLIYEVMDGWDFCAYCSEHEPVTIKYLHQLQNILSDLGEELNYRP